MFNQIADVKSGQQKFVRCVWKMMMINDDDDTGTHAWLGEQWLPTRVEFISGSFLRLPRLPFFSFRDNLRSLH